MIIVPVYEMERNLQTDFLDSPWSLTWTWWGTQRGTLPLRSHYAIQWHAHGPQIVLSGYFPFYNTELPLKEHLEK